MFVLIESVCAKHGFGPHVRQCPQLVQHKFLERFVGHSRMISQYGQDPKNICKGGWGRLTLKIVGFDISIVQRNQDAALAVPRNDGKTLDVFFVGKG